jgi:hypothetical protein
VAALGVRVELARRHIFDHTLAQRTDGVIPDFILID